MDIRTQVQRNPVGDEMLAIVAAVRPILIGLLWGLKTEVADDVGGRETIKLRTFARLLRPGDGDLGICFEYAVHDAMLRGDPMVLNRVDDALRRLCGLKGSPPESILFAVEKTGSEQLINTSRELVTPESRLMSGTRGQPAKLHKHIEGIAQAFRRPAARAALPYSISGVWKADLFLGRTDIDRWVATSVKVNANLLERARGLRVGVVPATGTKDKPYKDEKRNLVVCPLLHDGDFMQVFHEGWEVIQAFLAADAKMPPPAALVRPAQRHVAKLLTDRRDFPVLEVVEALSPFAQPELLETHELQAQLVLTGGPEKPEVQAVVAPQPLEVQ
jgi:hypothetical protein